MTHTSHAYTLALVALMLAGCGSDDSSATSPPGTDASMTGGGMDAQAGSDSPTPPPGRDAGTSDAHMGTPDSSTGDSGHPPPVNLDVCTVMNGTVAWQESIPATTPSLSLADVVIGPTDDTIVSDETGGTSYDQHRWDKKGTVVSVHQDPLGAFVGPLSTSNLWVDAQNNVFYGTLMSGMPQGANNAAVLTFESVTPSGTVRFTNTAMGSAPASAGPPQVWVIDAGGDSGGGLHSAVKVGGTLFQAGVYCYSASGSFSGISAGSAINALATGDYAWPTPDNGLMTARAVTASLDLGCGTIAVPAAGGVVLAKLDSGGGCQWNKLLSLPTAAVKAYSSRLGADGTTALAVVYAGSIDFGGGPLVNLGTTSLAVARFDAGGTLLWTKNFGGAGSTFQLGSLGINTDGTLMLTAGYTGTVDVGSGPLPASGDTFLAVLDATGNFKWSKAVAVGTQGSLKAAIGKCGVTVATNSPTVDLGTGPLSSVAPPMAASIGVAALGL